MPHPGASHLFTTAAGRTSAEGGDGYPALIGRSRGTHLRWWDGLAVRDGASVLALVGGGVGAGVVDPAMAGVLLATGSHSIHTMASVVRTSATSISAIRG